MTVSLPLTVAAPSLTVAGLAAWVFAHAGQDAPAARCGLIQDTIDEALRRGEQVAVAVPRAVAAEAAELWERAAALLDDRTSVNPQQPRLQEDQQAAARLRRRADVLRQLLRAQVTQDPNGE